MTMHSDQDPAFLAKAKEALDSSVRNLEPHLATRLQQARRTALESKARPGFRLVWAGGFATAAAMVLVAALWMLQPAGPMPGPALEDLDLLTSSENLEFYDDLEFYGWLAETGAAG